MSKFKHLESRDIFPIPLTSAEGLPDGAQYLIYAPLADSSFLTDNEGADALEEAMEDGLVVDNQYSSTLKELIEIGEEVKFSPITSPDELSGLSILPNWHCNFNCSYCYAANAHIKRSIPIEYARKALDYFISPNRSDNDLMLQILGGGEPTLDWKLVKEIAQYARKLAKQHSKSLMISMATNGSILNDEMIDDIRNLELSISYSFDLLEDVQNRQRGHFDKVAGNLKRLIDNGLSDFVIVRSVITEYNVSMLSDMVREMRCKYPKISKLIVEPVMGVELFESVESYCQFYNNFYTSFNLARLEAEKIGLELTTNALRYMDFTISRSCEGDFCLTPDGDISVCHRLTAPNGGECSKYVYAKVDDKSISFNNDLFTSLLSEDIFSMDECKSCFARYNCGGGCLARRLNEPAEWRSVGCDFIRKVISDELVNRVKSAL